MSDKPELKPCPFCGKPYAHTSGTQGYWMVECSSCGGIGPCFADFKDSEGKAIEAWNQRADLAKPSEWISVSDRLPEESFLNWVLVGRDESSGCPSVMQALFRDGEFVVISGLRGNFTVFKNPTHWQPLPSPPTRETP